MPIKALSSRCEQSLADAENLLRVQITFYDIARLFFDLNGAPLLPAVRQSHRRFIVCRESPRQYCLRHCKTNVVQCAASSGAPFTHECRQGLREIVVPVKTNDGILQGVLFAGFWRSVRHPRKLSGSNTATALKNLPVWNKQQAQSLSNILRMLAWGLIAEVDHLINLTVKPATRKAAVMRFIKYHATEEISLADLAHNLALSASRTSHLVKSLCGSSFQSLLLNERLARAKNLLVYSDYSIKEIAQQIGLPNEFYFNRAFRKAVGVPPGRYRRKRAGHADVKNGAYLTEAY